MDALRRLRIAKLTTTRGITNSLLTSSACLIGIRSTLALLNLIRWIFQLCYNYYLHVAQIKKSRLLVLIQSCNRHAIHVNVNKPSNANVLYNIKSIPERKLCLHGTYLIPLLWSQKPCNKEKQLPTMCGQRN